MAEHAAPALLIALEQSGLGLAIRQSVWAYPIANITHILALTVFAAAVAAMDLRLLGAFRETLPASVISPARRVAAVALATLIVTGLILFTAEASHVAMNPVFQTKLALISLGILNALVVQRSLAGVLAKTPAMTPFPPRFRIAAMLSLGIWLCVAGLGRFIAYV
jgi:hypothetical protein